MSLFVEHAAFTRWFKDAAEQIKTHTKRALELTTEAAIIYAKTSSLYKKRTGALHQSLRSRVSSASAQVSADGGHAHFVENGTRPHPIEAKNARVLRFVMNGEVVFRQRVYHPGTEPRPFMKEAQRQTTPLFSRLIIEAATFR